MDEGIKYLEEIFRAEGLDLSADQAEAFFKYYKNLISENEKYNLTNILDFREVGIKHFLDSALALRYHNFSGERILDVGSGAGFPGLPLAILNPKSEVTLIESNNKKTGFLSDTISLISIDNCGVISIRAEDGGKEEGYRESFDCVVSRAVAPLNILLEFLLPFVKVGGLAICYKSGKVGEEINEAALAMETLGGEVEQTVEYNLPNGMGSRSLVFIKKIKPTPGKFPRRAGIPKKRPLS